MGAGIPLVALMGRQPQILDYGQQMAQGQQIQAMRNQNALAPGQMQLQQQQIQGQDLALQQQKQQLADQQAATKAMQEWDGKDYGNFASLALKHGASATTIIGMKKALLDQQESALKMTETQRAIEKQNADYFAQGISNIEALPAEQQAQAFEDLKAQAVQSGRLNPQQAQQYQYKDPLQLEALRKLSIGHAAVMDEANKQATIEKENEQAALAKAEIPGKIAAGQIQQQEAALTPQERAQMKLLGEPAALEMKDWLAKNPGKGPADFLKYKATIVPTFNFNIAGGATGGLTKDALDQQAEKYYQTGQLPPVGRGPAGIALAHNIMQRANDLHPGESLAASSAEYKSNAASLKNVQKQFDQVNAFENTAVKNLDLFTSLAKKAIDTGIPLLNAPLRSAAAGLGSEDQAALYAARQVAINEIAKVTSNPGLSGQLSDSARHEVEAFNPAGATYGQTMRIAGILKQDMANRHDAYLAQIQDIQRRIKGAPEEAPQGTITEAPKSNKLPSFKDWKASQRP